MVDPYYAHGTDSQISPGYQTSWMLNSLKEDDVFAY